MKSLWTEADRREIAPLSAHAWGALTYRHADHHLRQFGV